MVREALGVATWVRRTLSQAVVGMMAVVSVMAAFGAAPAGAVNLTTCLGACSEWSLGTQEGGAAASWQVNFQPGAMWTTGTMVTLIAPAGATLPTAASSYFFDDRSSGSSGSSSSITVVSPNEVKVSLPFSVTSTNDFIYLDVGVVNPPAGQYPGSDFCIGDSSSTACLSGTYTYSGITLTLTASSVEYGGQIPVSGGVFDSSGPVSGATVTLDDGGAGGSFDNATPTSASDGSFSATYTASSSGGPATITASTSAQGVTPASANASLSVIGPPSALAITGPSSGTVDSVPDLGPFTVTIHDAFGNPSPVSSDTAVGLSASSASGVFSSSQDGGAISAVTVPSGQSSATFYYDDTLAASETLTAASSGLTGGQLALTTKPGPATTLGFIQEPANATVNDGFQTVPKVEIEDAYGNVVTQGISAYLRTDVALSIVSGTGAPGATITNNDLALMLYSDSTDTSMEAIWDPGPYIDTAGTGYELKATDGSLTGVSAPFTVWPIPTGITVTASPTVMAGQTVTVTGTVTDASGPEPHQAVDLYDGGAGGTWSSSGTEYDTVWTGSNGAFEDTYTAPTTAGSVTLTAQPDASSTLTASASVTVSAGTPSMAYSGATVASSSVTAGSGDVSVDVALEDANQNPVTGLTASDFSLTSDDPAVGTVSPDSITPDPNTPGGYTLAFTDTDTNGGSAQNLSVTAEGVTFGVGQVTVEAAAPSGISVQATPSSAQAGATVDVTGVVRDVYGNPVPSVGVTLDDGGAGGTFGSTSVTTGSDGSFSTSYQAPNTVGTVTLTASTGSSLSATDTLDVRAEAADPATSTVTVGSSSVTAGPGDVTLEVTLLDQLGNPYTGLKSSDFTVTSDASAVGTLSQTSFAETAAGSGVYDIVLTDVDAHGGTPQTLSIAVDGLTLDATVALTVAPATPSTLSLAATPAWVSQGAPLSVTALVEDAFGNPVPGTGISISFTTDSGSALGPTNLTSQTDGTATASLNAPANTIGLTVTATSGALTAGAAVLVVSPGLGVTAGEGAYLSGAASSFTLTSGGTKLTEVSSSGITGSVEVAAYGSAPDPPGTVTGSPEAYFDIHLSDATIGPKASLTICEYGGSGGSETVAWWNGSSWASVNAAATYDPSLGCTAFTLSATTTPALSDLTGTPFVLIHQVAQPPERVPTVSQVSPATGPRTGGTIVTIEGSGFTGATAVSFGSDRAGSFTVVSDSEITVTSPGGSGTVDVTVTTPAGTSKSGAADRFTYSSPSPPSSFSDVPSGFWARGAILDLVSAGVITGYPDGTFRPESDVTRAEFVKMLVLALGIPSSQAKPPFADVPADAWYARSLTAAYAAGIVSGISPSLFAPGATITREEMAVILARALKLSGSGPISYADAKAISSWARSGVQATVAAGYMQGFPNGTFEPLGLATRAQVASILDRILRTLAP